VLGIWPTFTNPQSLPSGPSHLPMLCRLLVNNEDDSPWGTELLILIIIMVSISLFRLAATHLIASSNVSNSVT